jgi:hypothetical protein
VKQKWDPKKKRVIGTANRHDNQQATKQANQILDHLREGVDEPEGEEDSWL